ncbi:cytitidyltransferase [Synechococcus phage ACG-2014f]|uniref:Cytitidyltransferase n=2 Tax=Atlauavirus TaxID=2733092 RepID=A0A0E3FKM0_9CAUD|nr:cytitidyltransferase [Synechococcus phage ACG-2014f_Syn7803C7]AIX20076.1 cytitidyltransferase [Synechococcus phage ACG-2014f_Syn7803C7]AIX29296.1 cytitidyltransferase [Synechococcus phage ACG-2014f]
MITPKSLLSFLSEAADSEAAQQAKEMGLTSAGYGNWRDRSGNVVAKTVDGQLVMIDAKADPMARPAAPEEEMPPEEEEEPQFVEPDPDMVEKVAKGLSGGRYNIASAQRKKELLASARQILINKQIQDAQMQADADAQAATQNPPEPTPEELAQQQADMELQQKNAVMDTELKAQSVENGKLDLQMKKDQMKQQKEAEKEAKAMDKLAKKAEAQKQAEAEAAAPPPMPQGVAPDAPPLPEEEMVVPDELDALLGAIRGGNEKKTSSVLGKIQKKIGKKSAPKAKAKPKKTPKVQTDRRIPVAAVDRTDVPQFQSEALSQMNAYLSENRQREEDDYYRGAAIEAVREQHGEAFYYFDEPNGVVTEINTPQGAADLMEWSTNSSNKLIGKSLKPFWKEVDNFHNNWADPELRDENNYEQIIEVTRPNRGKIPDSVVDSEWKKLKNAERKQLAEMGLGGAGGRANMFLKTDKDREKRGKSILKVYLEQGGRDAWLGSSDTNPISWKDMTVDHVHSEGDVQFWQAECVKRGMDPKDYQALANDPEVNYVMTRFGFNGAQKRDNSMDKLYTEMEKKYYSKGKNEVDSLTRGNAEKKMRKQLREQEYYAPLVQNLKAAVQSGNFTPEVYNELFDTYKKGRSELETSNGPRTDRSQMIMGRNESTDPWRSLAERSLFGYKIFAGDGLRAKKGGQIAGWSGVGGTTSGSNAADGEAPSYPFEDTAMDFYFDPIRRMALSSPENQKKADSIHKYTQFMGNAFVTGKIGSQEWHNYLTQSSQMMHEMLPDEWKGEYEAERGQEYLSTINRTLNKLNKGQDDLEGDNYAPDRNITELFKNSPQKSLADQGIEIMRSMMDPENFNAVDYYDRGNLYEGFENLGLLSGRGDVIMERFQNKRRNEI